MRYKAILIDADDTLFDFELAEQQAIREVLPSLAIDDERAPEVYSEINRACWLAFERRELTQADLKIRRFAELLAHYGVTDDPRAVSERYEDALSRQGQLIDGALEAVRAIAEKLPIAIVTNGIAHVQHGRMSRSEIRHFIKALVISEELGCAKPDPRMMTTALDLLGGVDPKDALMAGDSLSSDMRGALNAGVDACWYNPSGAPAPVDMRLKYVIRDIRELPGIALQ